MPLLMLGISHKTAKLETRERFSIGMKVKNEFLFHLSRREELKGAVVLSTCNRMEIYAETKGLDGFKGLMGKLSGYFSVPEDEIEDYFYQRSEADAVEHLVTVACGMDSQVIGETQIMAQVRSAWEGSKTIGISSPLIDNVFHKALFIAGRVHAQTGLSRGNVSLCSVALRICKSNFGSLDGKSILIVGAGKIAQLMIRYLRKCNMQAVFVANRTYNRAVRLAQECRGEAVHFDMLSERIKDVDIIITSTSAPHYLIRSGLIKEIKAVRSHRLLIIDLGVPRDVDPGVRSIDGVLLFDLDDLKSVVDESYQMRKQEIPEAQRIIREYLDTNIVERV